MPLLSAQDTIRLLVGLQNTKQRGVLIGGQALNIWIEHYRNHLPPIAAYTSKDIDFVGDKTFSQDLARALNGTIAYPSSGDNTPNVAKVTFTDAYNQTHEIDILHSAFGVNTQKLLNDFVPLQYDNLTLNVMNPIHCMESRASNFLGLPGYNNQQRKDQLQAAIWCARAFLDEILSIDEPSATRKALRYAERIWYLCAKQRIVKQLYKQQIDLFEAVPNNNPRFGDAFLSKRYPQMKAQLLRQRSRISNP